MNAKILLVTAFVYFNGNPSYAQVSFAEDTSISFNIILIDNETVNTNFLGSVNLYRENSFIITDFLNDTFQVKYHFPICTLKKKNFYHIRDSLFSFNKKYYIVLKLQLDRHISIKIPYFSLLNDNTLLISRKKRSAKKVDCYYTLIPKNSEFLPKTIICKGEIIR